VRTEEGKFLVFSYYDPRILRRYLPTCTPAEMERFFGPISAIVAEAQERRQFHLFRRAAAGFEHLLLEAEAESRVVQTWPAAEAAARAVPPSCARRSSTRWRTPWCAPRRTGSSPGSRTHFPPTSSAARRTESARWSAAPSPAPGPTG